MVSVLLSIEPEGYDGLVQDYGETHRFDVSALDSDPMRGNVRLGFAHFSGIDPALDSFRVPIGDRRRFVVLDTTTPDHEVLFITNDYRSAKSAAVMAAIDSVTPATGVPPAADPYIQWLADFGLEDVPGGDPDADGFSNELEFFFNSNPSDARSIAGPDLRRHPDHGRVLEYRSRLDPGGFEAWIEYSGDLWAWQGLDVPEAAMVVTPLSESDVQTTVILDMVETEGMASDSVLFFRIVVNRVQ